MNISSQEIFIPSMYGDQIFAETKSNSSHPEKTFIFLHGLAGDSRAYSELMTAVLSNIPNSQCISYDLRGYGLSSYTFPEIEDYFFVLAQDLVSVIQFFAGTNIYIMGQSMGANVASYFISSFPLELKKVEKVFLVGLIPSKRSLIPKFISARLIIRHLNKSNSDKKKRTLEEILKYKNSFDYSIGRTYGDIKHFGLRKYLYYWLPILSWKNVDWKQDAITKIVYLYGKHDILIPRAFHKNFLKSYQELKFYELNTNHNAVVNNPEEVADIIANEIGL